MGHNRRRPRVVRASLSTGSMNKTDLISHLATKHEVSKAGSRPHR